MFFITARRSAAKSGKYFQAQQKNLGRVNGYVEEMVDGLKVVKVFNHEQASHRGVQATLQRSEYRLAATNANFYAGVIMPIMGNLNNIAYAMTALFGEAYWPCWAEVRHRLAGRFLAVLAPGRFARCSRSPIS